MSNPGLNPSELPGATGIRVGFHKGFIVEKRKLAAKPSNKKGVLTKRTKLVREVVREVAGFAPYERRILELIKVGSSVTLKRALKFAKKRLGTHKRGKKKREELTDVWNAMKRKGA
uniref:60S ribosomal protein L36 n=1 Tax=Chromera velia CCMP2878 TaxID=1169474 RepID=A0A0G4F403_9ALVE|eukprot:Cvel_14978.t1-p1 / transcript=Cvel_14978.t1 / gene=Cvel_14978 / organism=Chromera_velia_CCMP2878 / gene_product=60S ribosomal protein L36-1, putative / transcript_product=60S ribosomal protein L36-1, putative / location=Cvel_scaffold1088:53387-54252(+) / protein_length=115 / sequence_SO=supercontig / SO=protein_coding / is_pseudo=false